MAERPTIVALIRDRTIDAEVAATVWLLIESGVPLIVAGANGGTGKTAVLDALLEFVSPATTIVEIAGRQETFGWLPQATELGWPGVARRASQANPIQPNKTLLHVAEFGDRSPAHTWGETARIVVRAASVGYSVAAAIQAGSLEEVFEKLGDQPVNLTPDELSHLGLVLVLGDVGDGRHRLVAAHYVRPVSRDLHGHLQRLGPAVLATWDPATDTVDHFGWGVAPELAMRIGRRPADFEREIEARRALLLGLAMSNVADIDRVRDALSRYRR